MCFWVSWLIPQPLSEIFTIGFCDSIFTLMPTLPPLPVNLNALEKRLCHTRVEGLNSAAGFIQSSIAKKLSIYKFPKLTFVVDTSIKDGFDMVNKLNRLEEEEKASRNEKESQQ